MANIKKIELTRVNMNLPSHIVERVKEYADNLGVNTTSAYIFLLNQALDAKETMSNLPAILSLVKELKQLQSTDNYDKE